MKHLIQFISAISIVLITFSACTKYEFTLKAINDTSIVWNFPIYLNLLHPKPKGHYPKEILFLFK